MARLDLQKFIQRAGESGIINLEVTLGDMVKSEAFGMLQGYDDPWDWWCGNDFRLIWWRPRGLDEIIIDATVASSVRETLNIVNDIKSQLGHTRR